MKNKNFVMLHVSIYVHQEWVHQKTQENLISISFSSYVRIEMILLYCELSLINKMLSDRYDN